MRGCYIERKQLLYAFSNQLTELLSEAARLPLEPQLENVKLKLLLLPSVRAGSNDLKSFVGLFNRAFLSAVSNSGQKMALRPLCVALTM